MQKSLASYTLILAAFVTLAVFASSTQKETESTNSSSNSSNASSDISQVIKPVNLDKDFHLLENHFLWIILM